jgi:hypothetical protein
MKLVLLSLLSMGFPLLGQIAQSHPEFCGIPGGINPPLPNVSVTIDFGNTAFLIGSEDKHGISLTVGDLPSAMHEATEVCPLSDGRLVLFGDYGGTEVFIIDPHSRSLIDSFRGFAPVISPDQHWIVYIKPYPLHGVVGSDQEMLYDLNKTPADNRLGGDKWSPGRVIFPPGHDNWPGSNMNLPHAIHHIAGSPFYWAADSRAILFWDGAYTDAGLVLVSLGPRGEASALRHKLTDEDLCGNKISNERPYNPNIERVGPSLGGRREILFDITAPSDNRCKSHILRLHSEDFRPARVEKNAKPVYTRGAVLDGKEVIPPKKK